MRDNPLSHQDYRTTGVRVVARRQGHEHPQVYAVEVVLEGRGGAYIAEVPVDALLPPEDSERLLLENLTIAVRGFIRTNSPGYSGPNYERKTHTFTAKAALTNMSSGGIVQCITPGPRYLKFYRAHSLDENSSGFVSECSTDDVNSWEDWLAGSGCTTEDWLRLYQSHQFKPHA